MKAMLLAAGLGTRMAPLTPSWEKPALPILDESLLHRMARLLAEHGISEIIVNAHRDRAALESALDGCPVPVVISPEPTLRGSGGGILGARPWLEDGEPFLVLNADMALEFDLEALCAAHRRSGLPVTLMLRDDPRKEAFGTIGYSKNGEVWRITNLVDRGDENSQAGPTRTRETGSGLFTGVHVMDARLFAEMPDRPVFDIVRDVWVPRLKRGDGIGSWLQPVDAMWQPVGSPAELLDANLGALDLVLGGKAGVCRAADANVEGSVEGPAWIGSGAWIESGAEVGPWAVIGRGARIPAGTRIEKSLVLPEARPPENEELQRAVAWAEEVWREH